MNTLQYFSLYILLLLFYLGNYSNNIYVVICSCNKINILDLKEVYIPYKVIKLFCNRSTNHIDSNEGGLMLDFIIKQYNNKGKNKYIFIHDHVKSWHYKESVYDRLYYLKKKNYINRIKFGGLYCMYLKFGCNRFYDLMFNKTYEIDKYMRINGFINISILQLYTKKYTFPCCATFIVDKSRIVKHPRVFYIKLRKGLREYVLKNRNKNKLAGNYMEYMWSIIFGIRNIPYPPDCNISYL